MKIILFVVASLLYQGGICTQAFINIRKLWRIFLAIFFYTAFFFALTLSILLEKTVWKELLIVTIANTILGIIILAIASIREIKIEKSINNED